MLLPPLTRLQSLYWDREKLHDEAFKLEQRMRRSQQRGHKYCKTLEMYGTVISAIVLAEVEMKVLEGVA